MKRRDSKDRSDLRIRTLKVRGRCAPHVPLNWVKTEEGRTAKEAMLTMALEYYGGDEIKLLKGGSWRAGRAIRERWEKAFPNMREEWERTHPSKKLLATQKQRDDRFAKVIGSRVAFMYYEYRENQNRKGHRVSTEHPDNSKFYKGHPRK